MPWCHRLFSLPEERFSVSQSHDTIISIQSSEFEKVISKIYDESFTMVCIFASESAVPDSKPTLTYVFERTGYAGFLILKLELSTENVISIGLPFPTACLYEREIRDGFGIEFINAKDNRRLFLHENYPKEFHPLRKTFRNRPVETIQPVPPDEEYQFKKVHGEGVYQIPVGPVHAGIIEPGHFRFSVIGESIYNLEVRMFWKHRGIEKLAEGKTPEQAAALAEAVSGDETAANTWAYCTAVERISGMLVPPRAEHLRLIFAEMERIYSLLGDMAGMSIDVAYPVGACPFFNLREEILRWNDNLSGSRFYKGAFVIGGIRKDVSAEKLTELTQYLKSFSERYEDAVRSLLAQPSVIDRFDTTGVVRSELVAPLNLTGPIARASGVPTDVRIDHPYGLYSKLIPRIKILDGGDVLCRFNIKADVIKNSVELIERAIGEMPVGPILAESKVKDGSALSAVESSRGQNVHWVDIRNGKIERYKVRTASFCNWIAIEFAVLNNIVPDFPLINKSMNLSYAGTDL
ncbi:MAG: NADH-quinone oxidoreductase subunit C [Thermoplasmata archaeon]|nr:NADH-quinone oxidoreductase subunit C [Thermoplasmata archaeon]